MDIVSEREFVKIIAALQSANDLQDEVNTLMRNSKENIECDFMNAAGLMICHESIVISLLSKMLHDEGEDIAHFIYDLDYGRKYRPGMITDEKGQDVDFSTAQKLYQYLINNLSMEAI